jgi:beta-fructofuranosidase
MELEDGRHFIMYTGVKSSEEGKDHQTQCIAVGDGLNYVKYENNPVISAGDLPEGLSPYDFRDPKVFRDDDGKFYCIAAGKNEKGLGQLLLYGSSSGFDWHYENTFLENDGEFGSIWECPDFFLINETAVVLTSPIGMEEKGYEYHCGNGTLCQIGIYDRSSKRFIRKSAQAIDHGADFYAPQTLKAPDGRRIMIGWMQSWATCNTEKIPGCPWFGQMSIARELTIKEDRLIQNPVREIELFRKDKTEYKNVIIEKKKSLEGIRGRSLDMTVSIRPFDNENIYDRFTIYFAGGDKHFSRLNFYPRGSVFETDRSMSGSSEKSLFSRKCNVKDLRGRIDLRIIMDKYSIEVFINGGEQVMTTTFLNDPAESDICFECDGKTVMDITAYTICIH